MKPLLLKKNLKTEVSSFLAKEAYVSHFYDKWHYHQEIEILFVKHGKGTRFVGDCVQRFSDGDLVLVGPNLPHVWKNDPSYFSEHSPMASAILIQFVQDLLPKQQLELPEMSGIAKLLHLSQRGVKIEKRDAALVLPNMEKLLVSAGANRLSGLIDLLEQMSRSKYELLSSNWFSTSYLNDRNERINRIYDHIIDHFREPINLEELAAIANMNKSALCRFFKSRTNKTITNFVNEIRIGYSFHLLNTTDCNVTEACFESGFNHLSYFNRQFKKLIGYPPSILKQSLH
ncbi:MAG: AraC family transcriptional regulator [Bacteroidota bacterium]